MMKGELSARKRFKRCRKRPLKSIARMPPKYAQVDTTAAYSPPAIAPAMSEMIGIFALQGIIVVVIAVMRRSFGSSIVRVDIIAGTPHPVAISIGMTLLPERPNLRKILSRTKATRDM